jgi:hypothetical protein
MFSLQRDPRSEMPFRKGDTMRKMLLTTAMIAALGCGAAYAQTTADRDNYGADITVPEGFQREEAALTAEDLLSASVYDARGDAVGEIEDLVMATGDTGAATGQTGTGTAGQSDMSTDATGTTGTGTTGTGTTGTDSNMTADQTGTTTGTTDGATGTTEGGTATADNTGNTDNSATGTTGDNTVASDNNMATDTGTNTTGNTTGIAGDGTAATDGRAGESVMGEVTHAIIDVGGFLGIGERRVALPISDLVVYRSDAEMRVYLPWTEEQLEELPVYNVNDPATLGTTRRTVTN